MLHDLTKAHFWQKAFLALFFMLPVSISVSIIAVGVLRHGWPAWWNLPLLLIGIPVGVFFRHPRWFSRPSYWASYFGTASKLCLWVANFNYETLRIISVHEVYPGHFVHHLHNRYGRDLPLVNRVASSYAFVEGWAHYTEQMMLETDYGAGQPALLLTKLLEALVRNCGYLCSIRMHTQGMSVDEATRFFMDNAYMGELPARREAMRGTFDPGYLSYTLGKLMILKLREDFRREQGSRLHVKGVPQPSDTMWSSPSASSSEGHVDTPGDSAIG